MKYLILTILSIFGSVVLSAQDTLYLKGNKEPLLVNITIVKETSLNFTKSKGGFVRTVKMENVKNIRFQKIAEGTILPPEFSAEDTIYFKGEKEPLIVNINIVKTYSLNYTKSENGIIHTVKMEDVERIGFRKVFPKPFPKKRYSPFDEFRSTISMNFAGFRRLHAGLNYLHKLENLQSKSGRRDYFMNVGGSYSNYGFSGGGYLSFPDIYRKPKKYSFELGIRVEVQGKRKPKNRFHIGLDFNNHWEERDTFIPISGNSGVISVEIASTFAVHLPIGYTFRTPKGFYFTTGLEFTTERYYYIPTTHIGLGWNFGK